MITPQPIDSFMNKPNSNFDLQQFYNESYKAGEAKVFTFFENGKHISEDHPAALAMVDWSGKVVLDVGCGTGALVREIAQQGALRVIGLDYAAPAIEQAQSRPHPDNIEFVHADILTWHPPCSFDVIVTLGTMEHLDEPQEFLKCMVEFLNENGSIIIACPHFLNPRGYVWMALATLLNVPMSLSDLHFIHPWHMQNWATELGMDAELVTTVDRNWAYGTRLLKDFDKRLRNALRDACLSTQNVDDYMSYLEDLTNYLQAQDSCNSGLDGATALYRLVRK
jgi:2-polyprenyl-3-methyl-5-hydroxy-6-metoxy-1,4-benzoquinol methylase